MIIIIVSMIIWLPTLVRTAVTEIDKKLAHWEKLKNGHKKGGGTGQTVPESSNVQNPRLNDLLGATKRWTKT